MGQQHIETIGMYGNKVNKEWPSELQCYNAKELKEALLDMVFNKQYGIFYYEPSDKKEAEKMCSLFEDKAKELRKKFGLQTFRDLSMHDVKDNKEWAIDFTFVAFPGLKTMGQRVSGFHDTGKTEDGYPVGEVKEFGTLIIADGELKIIQW